MKNVEFLGKLWEVPEWAKWITQDVPDGEIQVWEYQPDFINGLYLASRGQMKFIGFHRVLPTIKEI